MSKESDRELLVLAAKAAGMMDELDLVNGLLLYKESDSAYRTQWDPLEDDGEALRLAVSLLIDVRQDGNLVEAYATSGGMDHFCTEPALHDRGTATRRAIVRAAAEIGKQSQG